MITAAKDLDLSILPPDYRAAFEALQVAAAQAAALEGLKRLEHLVAELNHAVHGKKSEKLSEDAPKRRRIARRNRGNLPEGLPRIERVIEPDTLECPCGCGIMHKIDEDRTERLDIVPAQLRAIATVRPKYACRTCTDGVTQAPTPPWLIEAGLPTEGAIAHVRVSKYADHLPLYRQSQILARSGIDIHRSTLADWVGVAAFRLRPVVDRLAEHLRTSTKLFMDETSAPVLDPGRGRTKAGYFWALARDDKNWDGDDPPGVVYFYAPNRRGENAETFLTGINGILQLDGYQGYNRLTKSSRKGGDPIVIAHCWAHARRKLKEIFGRDGSEIAAEGLRRLAEIYAIEKDIRGTSAGHRLSAREGRSAPLVTAFRDWLQTQRMRVSAKSRLGEKLAYIHNHWNGLQTFLTDRRVEIDSNKVENLIRPIALNRKNAMFAGHDEGGRAWGRIASLIETAKINGVEPFAYLKSTLEAIAAGHPENRIDDLLPWNFQPSS